MDENKLSKVPFNVPTLGSAEKEYVLKAMESNHRHGSGSFTALATQKLMEITNAHKILLTHSCTGALELSLLLFGIQPGDEVILPSFTFSSTANAVILRGATPVFADIHPETQCLDAASVAELITPRTKALLPVHYAGVSCDMRALKALAEEHQLFILEDAAQALGASLEGKALGCFGELGALSFHDSKNISAGEGGALLINKKEFAERAEILWEKGTNRNQFIRGEVDKYTWCDLGSSFLMSEINAAFLLGQLERAHEINQARCTIWDRYYDAFAEPEALGFCKRPVIPAGCQHNGHIFYLMLPTPDLRNELLSFLKSKEILATFHYVPLHSSPAGMRYGRAPLPLPHTDRAGSCLIRLPLFPAMTTEEQLRVINATQDFFSIRMMNGLSAKPALHLTG